MVTEEDSKIPDEGDQEKVLRCDPLLVSDTGPKKWMNNWYSFVL